MTAPKHNLNLEECVRAFLDLAVVHPEKPPKTQRAERENQMLILGYNQAQEQLRTILAHPGKTTTVRAVAEVRNDEQQRPMTVGNRKLWVAS